MPHRLQGRVEAFERPPVDISGRRVSSVRSRGGQTLHCIWSLDARLLEFDKAAETIDFECVVATDIAVELVHVVIGVNLLGDRCFVAPAPSDKFVVVHKLDVAQVVKVSCLLVGRPFPCPDEVGSDPDGLDVPLIWVFEYETIYGGPIARGALLVELVVDV